MANIRRCPTCKVFFPTIDAVNDHYKKTSHIPLPYKCESCERVYKKLSSLQSHVKSKHPPIIYSCKPCNRVFNSLTGLQQHNEAKHRGLKAIDSNPLDAIDLDSRSANNNYDDNDLDTNVNGWDSQKDVRDCDTQRDPTLAANHPSALLNCNISKPLSSISELTSPSPTSRAAVGPSSSKLDKATAMARDALRNRFAELGNTTGETTPLLISNIWGRRKANSAVSNLDGSYSVATNFTLNSSNSNEKEVNESKLSLNSLDNITRPFTCPGCQRDFKSVSGFVIHIENRLCMSSMCHEIEDQLNACIAQFLISLASSSRLGHGPFELSRLCDTGGL